MLAASSPCSESGTLDRARGRVRPALGLAVAQHADDLDRVERHATGALQDLPHECVAEGPGARAASSSRMASSGSRSRRSAVKRPMRGAPWRAAIQQLGPCERNDQDRMRRWSRSPGARRSRGGPDRPTAGPRRREPTGLRSETRSKKRAPGGKQLLALEGGSRVAARAAPPGAARSSARSASSRTSSSSAERELPPGQLPRRAVVDPDAAPDHLGDGRKCDALAVRGCAPDMPRHWSGSAVQPLLELPGEPALPDSGDAQ